MIVFAAVAIMTFIDPLAVKPPADGYPITAIQTAMLIIVCVLFGLPIFIALLLLLCGLVSFSANVIQFGVDQLHDAPMEDSIVYIHWFVWTSYAGLVPLKLLSMAQSLLYSAFGACFVLVPLLLVGVTLCIQRYTKRHWFFDRFRVQKSLQVSL